MPEGQLTIEQLGQQTKAKYPAYKDMSDADVGNAVLKKYPQYQSRIITDTPKKQVPSGGLETATGEIVMPDRVTEKVPQETIVAPKPESGESKIASVAEQQLPELESQTYYAKLAADFPELQQNHEILRDLNDGYGKTWQAVMDSKEFIRKQTPSLTSEKLSDDAGQFIANALDLPSYVGGNVEAMLHGLENTRKGMMRMNPVSLASDPKDYFAGTLQFLNGGAETFFGAAMNTPAGYVFTQGINAEGTFGSGEATKIALAPLQSYAPKTDNELINEAYKTGDILWSLALFHDLHKAVKGQPEKTLVAGIADRIRGGKEVKGQELIDLTEAVNRTANPENLARLQNAAESLPKNTPPEKIADLTAKVAAIEPETMAKMPESLHPEIKIEVAPMIEQKQKYQDEIAQLETERVQLDDAFHAGHDKKIKYREGKVNEIKEQIAETIKEKPAEPQEEIASNPELAALDKPSKEVNEDIGFNLTDINGLKIKVGDEVKTTQPSGGIMSPADPVIGIVEKTKDSFGEDALQIRYKRKGHDFDSFILLNGKINEVVKSSESKPSKETPTEQVKTELPKGKVRQMNVAPKITEDEILLNQYRGRDYNYNYEGDVFEAIKSKKNKGAFDMKLNGEPLNIEAKEYRDIKPIIAKIINEGTQSKNTELNALNKEIHEQLLGDNDVKSKVFNYDTPYHQETVNGVDYRIASGLTKDKAKQYILYADGKIVRDDFKSIEAAKKEIPQGKEESIIGKDTDLKGEKKEVWMEESGYNNRWQKLLDENYDKRRELIKQQDKYEEGSKEWNEIEKKISENYEEEHRIEVEKENATKGFTPSVKNDVEKQVNDWLNSQGDYVSRGVDDVNAKENFKPNGNGIIFTTDTNNNGMAIDYANQRRGGKLMPISYSKGVVQAAKLKNGIKILDVTTEAGAKEFERVTGKKVERDRDYYGYLDNAKSVSESLRKEGYDAVRFPEYDEIFGIDKAGTSLAILNEKALEKKNIPLSDISSKFKPSINKEGTVYKAIQEGKYQKAISEGRMTANDAKTIIESAGLEVPKDILDLAKGKEDIIEPKPKTISNESKTKEAEAEVLKPEIKVEESKVEKTKVPQPELVSEQKYKIGKSPQTYTLIEKLKQTKEEKELGEQPVRVKNDRTGEEQVVLETDLTPVKSGVKSAKESLKAAKERQKKVYDEEGESLSAVKDPFRSAKRKAEADREVFDAYVNLAVEHVKEGVTKLSDFAKSIGEEVTEIVKNAWANATGTLPDSQLKTALSIVKNSVKGGLTKEQSIADAAKYLESTRWFKQFGGEKQSESMTSFIAESLKDTDLGELSTKDFRKTFSNIGKSMRKITSEKDFTESKTRVIAELVDYIKGNSQRFSEFDKRYFNGVLDNIKRSKTPISLGREVAKFNRALEQFGFRDLYKNAYNLRRSAKKNAARDKFGGITPEIRKFLSVDPHDVPIDQLDRYIGHLEQIGKRAKEVNARPEDIRDFNRMMQEKLDKEVVTEEVREEKTEDPEFKNKVITDLGGRLRGDKFDTSNLTADEIKLVDRLKGLTRSDLERLDTNQLSQLGMIASKLENGWLSNRVKLDILDKIDTSKQLDRIKTDAPQLFKTLAEAEKVLSDKDLSNTTTARDFFNSVRKTGLNYVDKVLNTRNNVIYSKFIYPFEQTFTQIKKADGQVQKDMKELISKLNLPVTEQALHGKKFREMNTKLSIYAKNLDWIANGGEGDLTKILLYGKDKKGNDHLSSAKVSTEDKIYLRKQYESLLKQFGDKNGELDLQKLYDSFTPAEKRIIQYVKDKFESDIKPKLYYTETYNRGGSFIPQNEYNPRKVLDERVTAPTAEDMVSRMIEPETPSTSSKAGATIERNQAVRFQSFDFIGDFIESAHEAYTDYYLSPTARKVFGGLTELGKVSNAENIGKIDGLKLVAKDALVNIINKNFEKQTTGEKAINLGSRIVINNMISTAQRAVAEPVSNMIGAASVLGVEPLVRGMKEYSLDRKYWNELLNEANSPILNRVGRYTADVAPVFENEIYIPNHTTKGISERMGRILDVLDKNEISEVTKHWSAESLKFGDAVSILPTWTAAYIKSVEKQTGKPFSKTKEYDAEVKENAFAYADNVASQTHNVSSAFAQARVIRESRDSFVKAISWFLRGFTLNDVNNMIYSGKDFWRGKAGGADLSRAQNLQIMGGVVAKQIAYAMMMRYLGNMLYTGGSKAIGAIADEDEVKRARRQEFERERLEAAKEVFTAEGMAKIAQQQALQLATGRMGFGYQILANNIAETINRAARGSSYDPAKDGLTYTPEIAQKIVEGKVNTVNWYDMKQLMGNYGAVLDRLSLTAEEANRIINKVGGDEELEGDDLVKWQTMNAMFFGLQAGIAVPFSGTVQRTIENEQKIQEAKEDPMHDAKIMYLEKFQNKSRDQILEGLDAERSVIGQSDKTEKQRAAEIRELEKVMTVAKRVAALSWNKEEKRIEKMGVDFPNEHGDVIEYLSKKTKDMTREKRAEYLKTLYDKYIISFDTYGRVISETN